MTEEEQDKLIEVAKILADVDGCEGGDLLIGIAGEAERSRDGYGYAYSLRTEGIMFAALQEEVNAHKEYVYENPDNHYSDEEIEDCKRRIAEVMEG